MGARWLSRYGVGLAMRSLRFKPWPHTIDGYLLAKIGKKSALITGFPEYTGTDMLVKSVGPKSQGCVHTMSPKLTAGCQLVC